MSAGVSLKTQSLHCVVAVASAEQGGLTLKALAKRSAIAPGRVRDLLTFAAKAGMLEKVSDGRQTLWLSPEAAQALRRARRSQKEAPRVSRWSRGEPLPSKPVRRQVPASSPLPFVCSAPSSVFAWRPA